MRSLHHITPTYNSNPSSPPLTLNHTTTPNTQEYAIKKSTTALIKPVKQKHTETLCQLTHTREIHALFRALGKSLREPNWIVVFKALILIHILIREGNTVAVMHELLEYPEILDLHSFRDKSMSTLSVAQSKNIKLYSQYLKAKIDGYRDIKIDLVRAKAEMISKFRVVAVDSEFMHRITAVQKQTSSLLDCSFYSDEIDNVVTMQAFRLLVGDMVTLFYILNEGVIKLLSGFFDMPKPEAAKGLTIYKTFASQTTRAVEFFEIARKLREELGVEVPKFNHAPISLAGALEEYLNSPDFDYQQQQSRAPSKQPPTSARAAAAPSAQPTQLAPVSTVSTSKQPEALIDFFASTDVQQYSFNMPTVQTWGGGAQFSEAFGSGVGTNFQTASSGFGGSGGAGMMSSATPSFATTTTGFGSSIASVSGNPFGMQQSFSSPGAMMMPASNNTDAAFTVENVFGGGGGDPFSAISNGGGGGGGMSNGLPQGFASMTMSKSSGGGVFATAGGKSFATANFGGGSAASNNPFASQGAKTNASVAGGGGFGSNNPFGGTATPSAAPAMAASSSAGGFTNNPFQSSGSSSISNRMSMPPIPSQQPQQQVFGGAGAPFGFGSSAAAPPNAGFAASAASNAFANGGCMFAPAPFGSAQTAGGSGASFAMQSANTFGQQQQQQQQPFSAGFGSMPGPGHMSMGPGVGSPAFNTSPRMAMGGVGGGPALQVVDPLANVNPFAKPAVPLAAMPGSGSGGGIPMPPSAGYASGRYGDR